MTLTINTNLSSIIAQRSLGNSTNGLNAAIERLTTGFKLNHAKDNAANYSISIDMSTKISSYEVAQNNAEMGMDLVTTANDSLSIINTHLSRIRELCEQGANGTYGAQSRDAIQAEINARVAEINRIQASIEYNGIKLCQNKDMLKTELLEEKGLSDIANITANKGPNGKFIEDIVEETPQVNVTDPTQLLTAIQNNTKIGIGNAETLAELATIVNSGTNNCRNKTIILTSDIDLSGYSTGTGWTPIGSGFYGSEETTFMGTFNGNGHVVSNLYINNPTADRQGLFGGSYGATIKNVGVENCNVTGRDDVGGLVGGSRSTFMNCYTTGSVRGRDYVGGCDGGPWYSSTTNCYSTCDVSGSNYVGGIYGNLQSSHKNCFATGSVTGNSNVGGFAGRGYFTGTVDNCFSTGDVSGSTGVGGFIGDIVSDNLNIKSSYSTGNVTGVTNVGGFVGAYSDIYGGYVLTMADSYCTGNVSGKTNVGGFVGNDIETTTITDNCVTLSESIAGNTTVGGFAGVDNGTCTDCVTISTELPLVASGNSDGIEAINMNTKITLQVGIDSSENSKITFDTELTLGILSFDVSTDESARNCLSEVDNLLSIVSSKQTEFGAIQNRLTSAIESITVSRDNLISSRSTLRDTDVAKESSEYIKQQILQQASATLLSTANQLPSIALQLI